MARTFFIVASILIFNAGLGQVTLKSRSFPTSRKNIPLEIINNDPGHFFVLRFNKEVHDLIVERRKKPGAEIISISPLRMDSVNAGWFDYQNLGHLFFEHQNRVIYVFEKVLNSERTVYLKQVDKSGKSGPFVIVQHLARDKNTSDLHFEYKLTENKHLLVVSTKYFWNGSVKKQVSLYDPFNLKMIWQKQLPIENQFTGYSQGFQCNSSGDLFYILVQASMVSQKRVYMNNQQVFVPVFFYNKLEVKSYVRINEIHTYAIPVQEVWGLYGASLFPAGENLSIHLHYYSKDTEGRPTVYLYNALAGTDLNKFQYEVVTPLDQQIDSLLTYYDGTDEKEAATKEFVFKSSYQKNNKRGFYSHRQDENFSKEVLFYDVDLTNGRVDRQVLLPRKIFSFDQRGRFRNIGEFAVTECEDHNYYLVMENKRNDRIGTENYKFSEFSAQRDIGGELSAYYFNEHVKKQYFVADQDFDFVPLTYTGMPCEYIMYLNKVKVEKFVILNLRREP